MMQLRNFACLALILATLAPTTAAAWEHHDPVFVIDPVSKPVVTTIILEC